MRKIFLCASLLLLVGTAQAQPGGINGPFGPNPTEAIISVGDVTAAIGGTFELQIDVTSDSEIYFFDIMAECDSSQVAFTGFEPGAGLQAFIDENGPLSCDAALTPENLSVFMFFVTPFDTELYGTDFLRIQMTVNATAAGSTEVNLMSGFVGSSAVATVTIDGGTEAFVRGDVSGDGTCNLADAIDALSHIFLEMPIPCHDAADVNDDGALTLLDPLTLLQSMFGVSEPLVETCGPDLNVDSLSCSNPSGCP